MTTDIRTAAAALLECFDGPNEHFPYREWEVRLAALRAALDAPQGEPASREWIRDLVKDCGLDWHRGFVSLFSGDDTNRYEVLVRSALAEQERIAAAPPQVQRQPLTDADIQKLRDDCMFHCEADGLGLVLNITAFARAIERAHGIGAPK
jgi:hypothetical protein